ncbi:cytosine transporter [Marinomonas sp. MED121]|nr:cytosine transporter [Marinomonas sp. MED121]
MDSDMFSNNDFPLSPVPLDQRKGFVSMTSVLLGFTFFTATMWAGGKLGSSFSFYELIGLIFIGNLLLGGYAASLGYIAYRTGLNTVLLSRYCFGNQGSKLVDLILGFTQIGWYAWGTATIAIVLVELLNLPQSLTLPLMLLFGFAFCLTALIGYRGLEFLSKISVPAMLFFIGLSLFQGAIDIGGIEALISQTPEQSLSYSAAITLVFGTFVSGATQATNWSRFSKSGKIAITSTLLAFFIGNGLMIFVGAFGVLVYQEADMVDVLVSQGFMLIAVLMLFSNIWTTQDNTIYNFAAAGCHLLRTKQRSRVILAGASIGTLLAVFGMYEFLIPFLILLGTFIPPIGAIIITDFWLKRRHDTLSFEDVTFSKINYAGLIAYSMGSGAAYLSEWVAPIIGILVAAISYGLLDLLLKKQVQIEA